jgi:class 3 adenylate cyclase
MTTLDGGPRDAGRAAFERHDWERAYELLSAAEGEVALDGSDLERLAQAAQWSRRFEEMLRLLERAEASYRSAGDRRAAGRVALKLAREYYYRRNNALMGGWYARAQTLLEGEEESREGGMLLWMRVHGTLFASGVGAEVQEESIRLAEQLVALGRRLPDGDLEALGLLELGHWLIIAGRVQEGSRLMDEANALASAEASDLDVAGTVYCSTIFACRNIGDWSRAAAWTARSLDWCERNSVSGFPGLCRLHRAEVIRFRGALEEAERDARAACDELLLALPQMAGWAFHELGEVLRRRGDLDGARAAFARALDLGFDPQPGLALLRLDEGDGPGAFRAISRRLSDRDPFTHEARALLLPALVTIALAADDQERAAAGLTELEQVAEACAMPIVSTSAVQARGELALSRGAPDAAVSELRTAWRGWCDAGAPYEAAQARVLLGRAYRQIGDLPAASLELEGARDVFARLGAQVQTRRVDALLADLPGDAAQRETRTFMFTDIVDSSRLVELLGDESWALLLSWHDRTLRGCFGAHRGREVKHEGDGFFVAFPGADAALQCAQAVQRSMRDHRREHGFAPQIRIGVHTAEATVRGGDYVGHGVHAASRVASAGGAGEILASAETLEAAVEGYDVAERRLVTLKGLADPVELVRVDWA